MKLFRHRQKNTSQTPMNATSLWTQAISVPQKQWIKRRHLPLKAMTLTTAQARLHRIVIETLLEGHADAALLNNWEKEALTLHGHLARLLHRHDVTLDPTTQHICDTQWSEHLFEQDTAVSLSKALTAQCAYHLQAWGLSLWLQAKTCCRLTRYLLQDLAAHHRSGAQLFHKWQKRQHTSWTTHLPQPDEQRGEQPNALTLALATLGATPTNIIPRRIHFWVTLQQKVLNTEHRNQRWCAAGYRLIAACLLRPRRPL